MSDMVVLVVFICYLALIAAYGLVLRSYRRKLREAAK